MRENELFESYLVRHVADPDSLVTEEESKRTRFGSKKRRPKVETTLTYDQKLDVVNSELEQVGRDVEETKTNSTKMIDTLTAVLEETDVRIAELKKEAYEFKRDIVVGAENFRTGKTMAERVVRWMEDKLRHKDTLVEKLRLKNATLKTQIKKLEASLRQKEEMGDVLHYIDFHQLQIENKQYVAKIEERNQELLKLKLTTGNTVQVLNSLKQQLSEHMTDATWLRREISQRKELLAKLRVDNEDVSAEISKSTKAGASLRARAEDVSGMPEVLDYVKQKAEHEKLRRDVESWRRKVEIAEMSAKRPLAGTEYAYLMRTGAVGKGGR
jgi:chromosome segregation ATPase